jgi:dienelactone hydrolase
VKILAFAGIALWLAAASVHARTTEEVIDLPVSAKTIYGHTRSQAIKVVIWRDDARKRAPFMILNHGRPGRLADQMKMGLAKYTENSKYFVARGFAVFVPTRIGYGASGGDDVEYSGECGTKNYPPVFEAAAQQSLTVLEFARGRPYVDPARGLVLGQSQGGTTAVALAAKNPDGVVAAVNFAGGGGGDPVMRAENPCRDDLLEALFAGYGGSARVPMLWVYSENDKYWGKRKPHAWFAAFKAKGAPGQFVQLPPLPPDLGDDGHASFTRNPAAWRPAFEAFLREQGF